MQNKGGIGRLPPVCMTGGLGRMMTVPAARVDREHPHNHRKKPRIYPLHPFLFAMASVLAMMTNNLKMLTFSDVAPALLGTLGFAALVYLVTGALRRRFDAVTAIIASIWVVGGLYFLDVFRPLNRLLDGGFTMVRTLPVALVILALLTVAALRLGRAQLVVHTLLNGVALVLFVLPAWQAVSYERRNAPAREAYDADRAAAGMPQIAEVSAAADGERPPDIYHFIFDRLGSDAALSQYYGLDDHISDWLESKGFYVARDSHSNYLKTGPSIASTFYMDYIDFLAGDPRIEGDNWHPLFEMLGDHRAARFLRARGYDFVQYGSWWAGTHENPVADENHPLGFSEFNMLYLRNTMLRPLFQILPATNSTRLLGWDNGQCQRVARQIEMIKSVDKDRPRPVYVFAHILVPHGPYPFTPDGRCLSQDEQSERGDPQGYRDQVAYAGNIIRDVVGALQAPGRDRPVILIQADEGPFPDRDYSVPWQDAPADELRIKTAILNAFYFPSGDYSLLRPDITPVNSYRVLFDTVFDAGLPLLPDRIFAFPNDKELYDFHDVTGVIRGDTAAKH